MSVNNLGDLGEMSTWAPLPAVAVPPLLGVWLEQCVHGLAPKLSLQLKLLFFPVMLLLKMVGIDLSFDGLPLQQPNKIVTILCLADLEQHLLTSCAVSQVLAAVELSIKFPFITGFVGGLAILLMPCSSPVLCI